MNTEPGSRDQSISKNREYTADVTGMTHEGLGVARIGGFVVFVKDAIAGETVKIKIIKVNKSYAVGRLLQVIKESENRREPFCSIFNRCGGCTLQHMSYAEQLKFKEGLVRDALERVGGLGKVRLQDNLGENSTDITEEHSANLRTISSIIKPIIGMEKPFNYRNKSQYPVQMVDGKIRIGFFSRRSHDVIEGSECRIQDETSERAREAVRRFLESNHISIYDDATGKGLVRHVVTRKGFATGEVMVAVVINGRDLPCKEMLIDILKDEISGLKSVILNINREKTNVILGEKNVTIYGSDYITDKIGRFEFIISPNSFFQVNPVQTEGAVCEGSGILRSYARYGKRYCENSVRHLLRSRNDFAILIAGGEACLRN